MSSKLAGKRKRDDFFAMSAGRPQTTYKKRKRFASAPPRRRAISGEIKFHDVDLDDAVIAAGCNVTPTINIIAQGVTESERVGRKCTITQIQWRWRCFLPEQDAVADPAMADGVRMIVFQDKQANGATAVNTDILETNDWQSFRNLANVGRFNILFDHNLTLNYLTLASDGAGLVSSASVHAEGTFFKVCDIPLEFNAAAGTIDEVRSNNIGVMLCGSNGIMGFDSKFRLRFSDH